MKTEKVSGSNKGTLDRRAFLKNSFAGSGFMILPSYAVAAAGDSKKNDLPAPSERLNLAVIGCSHRGGSIGKQAIRSKHTETIALCDVKPDRADDLKRLAPKARIFQDFRKMFDELGGKIDACTVGVPDHSHFPITMRAMSEGTAVYVEKPLAHTFEEIELMIKGEKKFKVACQMGNQGHSGANFFQFREWVNAGVIKNVRRVDAHMNKGRRWHPWGNVAGYPEGEPVPEGMDWDIWAGTAPLHPYHSRLDKGNWRGWYDYGNGAFGDWGPHTLDTIHEFLKLGLPYEIRADKLIGPNKYIYPMGSTIAFEFAERGPGMPEMTIYWYDGTDNPPPHPEELAKDRKIGRCGKIIYSDDLVFKGGTHGSTLRIIPEDKMREMAPDLPKISGKHSNHMENFLLSALGREKCRSSFDVSGPLTQVFMLGCIAQRLGGKLEFDTETKQITNNSRANALLAPPPRKGWEEFYRLA